MSRDRFLAGMARLGVDVSRETLDRLETYAVLLTKWQKAINLVGPTTVDALWVRHILDSAQLLPLLPPGAPSLADLGSGAGLPGLILAAFRPTLALTLIESDARKAAFLGEAARAMALPQMPKIVIARIETAPPAQAEIVTARALAPLEVLLGYAERHRARTDTAICLFHKGRGWQAELTQAERVWTIRAQTQPSQTDRDSVLLRIGAFEPRPKS